MQIVLWPQIKVLFNMKVIYSIFWNLKYFYRCSVKLKDSVGLCYFQEQKKNEEESKIKSPF